MAGQSEEWGPWVDHDGRGCPVQFGTVAEVTERANVDGDGFSIGDERIGVVVVSKDLIDPWFSGRCMADVIRYRIRKPRALSQLKHMIENLPERLDV